MPRNKELVRASNKRYYEKNKEKYRLWRREWYEANKKRSAETSRKWRQRTKQQRKEVAKRWALANRSHQYAVARKWREANKERIRRIWREKFMRRRARMLGSKVGPVSYDRVLKKHGRNCHICKHEILLFDKIHMDHVIPLAKGGSHTEDNLRPSHDLCNMLKRDRIL